MDGPQLEATYSTPTETASFATKLPALPVQDVKGKTEYLAALRTSLTQMQGQVNTLLTQKMEDEKTRGDKAAIDEEQAEATYGEEDEA